MLNEGYKMFSDESTSTLGVIDTFIRWKQKNNSPRGYDKYHPSEFGHCLRKMQYMKYVSMGLLKVLPEDFTSKQLRLFAKGHNMHNRWQRYFEEINVLRGVWKCSNPLCKLFNNNQIIDKDILTKNQFDWSTSFDTRTYGENDKLGIFKPQKCECGHNHFIYQEITVEDKEINMLGHADLIIDFSNLNEEKFKNVTLNFNKDKLPKQPFVIDMKTVNDFRYKQLTKDGPSEEYIIQLTIYANILDLPFGLLIYENKNSSDVLSFKIEKNEAIFEKIKIQAKSMIEMATYSPPLLPPPRPVDKDDYGCGQCGFSSICHKSKIWEDEKLNEKRKKFYNFD
jgi:hypothetical protein